MKRAMMISMAVLAGLAGRAWSQDKPAAEAKPADVKPADVKPIDVKRVEPKALNDNVKKGLAWLVKNQNADGGWNQGEMSAANARGGEPVDKSNVADTCMAALAFLRAGSTPAKGDHAENLRKALDFVCGHVERSSADGLLITDIKGTRVQSKLGSTVDTFASALLLAECRNSMPDEASRKRVVAALDKVMDKIEKNQKEDGRWVDANDGWAGALCQSLGHKAINTAARAGAQVSDGSLVKAEKFAKGNFNKDSGAVAATGSASVELYARASNLSSVQESDSTNAAQAPKLVEQKVGAAKRAETAESELVRARDAKDEAGAKKAQQDLAQATEQVKQVEGRQKEVAENAETLKQAQAEVVKRLDDKQFVAGFGSNGGEEFLSYMKIGESLCTKGGDEFTKWDKSMAENLNRIQNEDGSWSGHHCITGRTFCTATALLTLTVDRIPAAVAAAPAVGEKLSGEARAR